MTSQNDSSFISKQVRQGEYYFLDLNPPAQVGLKVVCGGCEVCGHDFRIERPGFRYSSLEFVSSGRGQVVLAGKAYPLNPGSAFYYGPEVPHVISVEEGQQMVKYFVDFVGEDVPALIGGSPLTENSPVHVAEPLRVQEIYEDLQRSGNRQTVYADRICAALLELLILRVSENAIAYSDRNSMSWATYEKCRRYIHKHFADLQSLQEVAAACNVSEPYLCRVFRRYGKSSPYQLISRLKMARAASFLLQADLLVKEVAARSGYDDPYHFSKAFKRVYGVSPEAFRTSRRGQ
jgi:AraC-like DNA-binding protein